jgi:hypothetical protein
LLRFGRSSCHENDVRGTLQQAVFAGRVALANRSACDTKGIVMPKVVITHAVEDIERWLQGKAERSAAIESGSGSNVTDYLAADGSTNIAITADVSDVAAMQEMLTSPSPQVLAAMQSHGVVQPITAYIEK